MKNKSISQSKSKSRSLNKTPSSGLIDYMGQKYPKNIPIAAITAAQKMYGKTKPLNKDDKILKRYADNKGNIDAPKLI